MPKIPTLTLNRLKADIRPNFFLPLNPLSIEEKATSWTSVG